MGAATGGPVADRRAVPRLAAPLRMRHLTLANRLILAPMSVSYADPDGYVTGATVDHYARRAAGGAAMVITENMSISDAARQLPRQIMVSGEEYLPGLTSLATAIKEHGAVAVAQIVHSGRYAGPWDDYAARPRLAPSAVPFELRPGDIVTPTEMSEADIEEAISEFRRAATLVRAAGFDGVEIHGAQGFLVSSFQSPRMNLREDDYGTDRNLFARRVIEAVREGAGAEMLVGFHLMSDEMMEGGWGPDDAVRFAAGLGEELDFLVPIATTFESLRAKAVAGALDATRFSPEVASALAAATSVPVFGNGGLGEPETAEAALAEGAIRAVLVGRPMLCDPDLPRKVLRGEARAVISCPCDPPRCLQTQMAGSICMSWPPGVQERGHWGLADGEMTDESPCGVNRESTKEQT